MRPLRWQPPAEFGATLPADRYADPTVHAVELEHIFRREWQVVGRDCDLANPGDVIRADVGDVPVIVVRGKDGNLCGL